MQASTWQSKNRILWEEVGDHAPRPFLRNTRIETPQSSSPGAPVWKRWELMEYLLNRMCLSRRLSSSRLWHWNLARLAADFSFSQGNQLLAVSWLWGGQEGPALSMDEVLEHLSTYFYFREQTQGHSPAWHKSLLCLTWGHRALFCFSPLLPDHSW